MKKFKSFLLSFVLLLLTATMSFGQSPVSLNYDALPGAVGYKVYYGTSSGNYNGTGAVQGNSPIDVGNATSTVIEGLSNNSIWYFKIVGYDSNLLEGPGSSEIRTYRIASVSSSTANGTYYLGQTINITLHFLEQMKLENGSIVLTLNTGNTIQIDGPVYWHNDFTASYTVQPGDNIEDLNVTSIVLTPGATFTDSSAHSYCLGTPVGTNLGDLKDIVLATPSLGAVTGAAINCP